MNRIQVVLVAANPRGTTPLQLGDEVRRIESELAHSAYAETIAGHDEESAQIQIRPVWAAQLGDVVRNVIAFRPSVVHFSGHGEGPDGLIMVGESGRPIAIPSKILRDVFAEFASVTRLVLLNACHSAVQAEEICQVIDCVIGMRKGITDQGAALFAAALYGHLALGSSVGSAFRLARSVMAVQVPSDADIPCLQYRAGIEPDEIYLSSAAYAQARVAAMTTAETKSTPAGDRIGSTQPPSLSIASAGYNRRSLREFVSNVLIGDVDLDAFCSDFFPATRQMFAMEMSRIHKLTLLLDREEGERILRALREFSEERYDRFHHLLRKAM